MAKKLSRDELMELAEAIRKHSDDEGGGVLGIDPRRLAVVLKWDRAKVERGVDQLAAEIAVSQGRHRADQPPV